MTTNNKQNPHFQTHENDFNSLFNQLRNNTINAKEHFVTHNNIFGSHFCDKQLQIIQVLESKSKKIVRYDHQKVQKDIDELYKKDPRLNGVIIKLYWGDTKDDKLGQLKYSINGNN